MASLLDIAPAGVSVLVRGSKIEVQGVSAKGIASLLARFPELRDLMTGKEVEMAKLLTMGGDAVAAIIAAGLGKPGDSDEEDAAGGLSLDEQADLLTAILRATMPGGVAPFVEKLGKLGVILNPAAALPGKARASKS